MPENDNNLAVLSTDYGGLFTELSSDNEALTAGGRRYSVSLFSSSRNGTSSSSVSLTLSGSGGTFSSSVFTSTSPRRWWW